MRPSTREWALTGVPGLLLLGLLLLMGAPLWAAFGMGGIITELRQVPLRIREDRAGANEVTAAIRQALTR